MLGLKNSEIDCEASTEYIMRGGDVVEFRFIV